MLDWIPHVTVATVVVRNKSYLLVEERDKVSGEMVFNQPAGHLEADESLADAALRETCEETGWQVELTGVLGIALYNAPTNGVTYHRTTFVAQPLHAIENSVIDPDISKVHWMEYEDILSNSARMRSPLVIASIEQYRNGHIYPLDLIYGQ
ncbi:MAG: ADP-ribose pyrophosphatase YjhB (NUDIX family) [Halioglobus sp.]|jgi:ADP-ribose pyrophosphatase YjhB (NUDIX family)